LTASRRRSIDYCGTAIEKNRNFLARPLDMTELPSRMRAVIAPTPGGPEALTLVDRPLPEPGEGEILIRVATAGVNRPDVLQRQGYYAPMPGVSDVLGLEVAGEVVARGSGATRQELGARVLALVPGGGYAQYCLAHQTNALPVPSGVRDVEAAAIPETYFTVWTNVFDRGHLASGETLLVHGGSSGIGTTAILLAKAFGARVITTVGSEEKAAACRRLGADLAINYREEDFVEATKSATNGHGAEVILDMVGGDYVARNHAAARVDGRIVQIAFLQGAKVELDLRPLMMKRLTHTGSTLRPRSAAEKAVIADALHAKVWPLLEAGRCKPVIDSVFPLADVAKAHSRMESSMHVGKIVLTI
jgi:NADPH2:quinone reductase